MQVYLSNVWYHLQLLLNDGQGQQGGHDPIDYGYMSGLLKGLFVSAVQLPGAMLQTEYSIKALQEFTLTGTPPSSPNGWHPVDTNPEVFVDFNNVAEWSGYSSSTIATVLTAYTQAWFNQASQYTPAQYYQGGWASPSENPSGEVAYYNTVFGPMTWYTLPRLENAGVPASLIQQIGAWASKIWPAANWTSDLSALCTGLGGSCAYQGVSIF
jgi:hypothetical protein